MSVSLWGRYCELVQLVRRRNGLPPLPNVIPVDDGDLPALIEHMEKQLAEGSER